MLFGRQISRARISLHDSQEDLQATSGASAPDRQHALLNHGARMTCSLSVEPATAR